MAAEVPANCFAKAHQYCPWQYGMISEYSQFIDAESGALFRVFYPINNFTNA